jgi:hypothetical protein
VNGLIETWRLYKNEKYIQNLNKIFELYFILKIFLSACILLILGDVRYNLTDHRLLEYKMIELEPKIKLKRMKFSEIYERGRLDEQKKLIMYEFEKKIF